ncbi:hypothetical protein K488DRAFT_74018 [Vararia minispora EC-137]|uniref:Uncharacterized protein n=1 Tax=Vararia minispora EC-137 TaxID=1314806 RepID=A0ACB8Q8I9_9AGAM|nr:hypothetical protein K488DRAFT_74018 [Vararia minispora EC-137]
MQDFQFAMGKLVERVAVGVDDLWEITKEGLSRCNGMDYSSIQTDIVIFSQNSMFVQWTLITKVNPQLHYDIKAQRALVHRLNAGRLAACRADIASIKNALGSWPSVKWTAPFSKGSKATQGYLHDICGHLLYPSDRDWMNESGQVLPHPDCPPNFVYADEPHNLSDLAVGFMKGELLVSGYEHVHLGPGVALRTTAASHSGNAAIYGFDQVTVESIAYTAMIIYFVLSPQTSFHMGSDTSNPGSWAFAAFYRAFVFQMRHILLEEELVDLLSWWTSRIFPKAVSGTPQDLNSVAGQMLQQRMTKLAARAAAAAAAATGEAEAATGMESPETAPSLLKHRENMGGDLDSPEGPVLKKQNPWTRYNVQDRNDLRRATTREPMYVRVEDEIPGG